MGRGGALTNESPAVAFFGISIACILISQALAYFTSLPEHWPGTVSTCAFLSIGLQWLIFIPSAMLSTEKFFDLSGSLTYMFLAVYSLTMSGHYTARQLLVTLFVIIWATRLGAFLFLRIQRAGKDGRFDEIKHNLPRFFNMWTIQGLWVFLTELPLFVINSTPAPDHSDFPTWSDYLGMVLFGLGFACEVIADNQKTQFSMQPENEGRWIQTGLWAYSRHPNYFGEILLWLGIFFISSSAFTNAFQWLAIESPFFVAFLLMKVSGVPLLEARADAKWGQDPAYQEYKARTPELIPLPTSLSALAGISDTSLSERLMEDSPADPEQAASETPADQPIVES